MAKPIKILSLQELKEKCAGEAELFMILAGCGRSSKRVSYDKETDQWEIFNEIDETHNYYQSTEEFRKNYPKFFEAMEKGCLFDYNFSDSPENSSKIAHGKLFHEKMKVVVRNKSKRLVPGNKFTVKRTSRMSTQETYLMFEEIDGLHDSYNFIPVGSKS